MTGNGIGAEGAKAMSEMLKVNKTLKSLTLNSEEEKRKRNKMKEEWMTGNSIGVDGAKALSEMLKVNNTLTSLNLESEEEKRERKKKKEK